MSFQVLAKEIIDEFVQRIWVNKNEEIQYVSSNALSKPQ